MKFPPLVTAADLPPVSDRNTPHCFGGCGTAMHHGRQVCPPCWAQLPQHLQLAVRRYRRLDTMQRLNLTTQIETHCARERARPR